MPRFLALLPLVLALALGACGGDDENGGGGSSSDVDALLSETFSGDKKVDSGVLDFSFRLDAKGEGSEELEGPVEVSLKGPFDGGDGETDLPRFDLDASFKGAGQSLSAGATSTGAKGFVNFQGTEYVLSDEVFQQFKSGYEQAAKQGQGQQGQSFASLGMNPREWLTDPKDEGEADVGGEETIKITGGVDVDKLLDDIDTALGKASSLGLQNSGQVPEKLTAEQRRQVKDTIKDPRVEIYTGKDDKIMRRLVVNFALDDPDSDATGTVALDVSIAGLNEGQDIAEPSGAKPFEQLLSQLGGLGAAAGGSGSGSGSGSGAGSGEELEAFSKCLEEAGEDVEAAQKCSELLTP